MKDAVGRVTGGANAGAIARVAHQDWYRALFQPCVAAGLMRAGDLAGYRNHPVYLRTSRYAPPRWEGLVGALPSLFASL